WIRGHEADRLETGPTAAINLADYSHPAYPNAKKQTLQYLLNRRSWKSTEDYLAARVFNEASHWLENNAGEGNPFYLHIESFWPHEFWDPPEDFYRMYMKSNYKGPRLIFPPGTTEKMSPVEIEHARSLYAGLVTFVDDRIGKFLGAVERLGLMKNTIIRPRRSTAPRNFPIRSSTNVTSPDRKIPRRGGAAGSDEEHHHRLCGRSRDHDGGAGTIPQRGDAHPH